MRLRNLISADLSRALLSPRFPLCACGVSLTMFSAIAGMLKDVSDASSVWYFVHLSLAGSGMATMALWILPVIAYGIAFAMDWEDKAVSFWVVRTGATEYTVSRLIASAISGFLTIVLGMGILIAALHLRYPLYVGSVTSFSYDAFMEQGHVLPGLFLYVLHVGLSGSLAAVCAMWASTYVPNRFVTAIAPLVLYFTLTRFTSGRQIPAYLNPIYWMEGVYSIDSPAGTLLIKLATVLILCSLMGIASIRQMKRRILHA